MKAAIYIREPMDDENTRYRLIEKATKYKWEYTLFNEVNTERHTRPVKSELLMILRRGEFRIVMVEKLESWANGSTDLLREISELTKKGIVFISSSDQILVGKSRTNPRDLFLLALERFEQSILNEKARMAIKRSKSKGKFPGRPRGSKDRVKRRNDGYFEREKARRNLRHIH